MRALAVLGSLCLCLQLASPAPRNLSQGWSPFKKPKNGCAYAAVDENLKSKVDENGYWVACDSGICCYDDETIDLNLGCFENGPTTKWCHQLSLPDSPAKIDPQFFYYTPTGQEQLIDYRSLALSVKSLSTDGKRPLYVLVHGFGGEWPKTFMFPMRDALLQLGNDVIITRWTTGSAMPDYFRAVANTRVMGVLLARLLEQMADQGKTALGTTHLVGFSLGAHVVGYAGNQLNEDGRRGLRRIIGLDPAGPLYANDDPLKVDPTTRLNPSNAQFVQCMHGNGEPLTHGGAGTMQAFGHVDFYANGGQVQPGCSPGLSRQINDLKHFHFTDIFGGLACSHDRNTWLFTTSVMLAEPHSRGCQLFGIRCPSTEDWDAGRCFDSCPAEGCPTAGYQTDLGTTAKGQYYYASLAGNHSSSEFCGRVWRLTITPENSVKGEIYVELGDAKLQGKPYLFQRSTEGLSQGKPRAKVMVWEWEVSQPTHLTLHFTAASAKDPQGLAISLLTLQEHGSTQTYTVAEPAGVVESKKPFVIKLPKAPQHH